MTKVRNNSDDQVVVIGEDRYLNPGEEASVKDESAEAMVAKYGSLVEVFESSPEPGESEEPKKAPRKQTRKKK